MNKFTILILLLTIGSAHAVTYIGTDGACDTTPNNLQSRINNSSISEIRLTNQQSFLPIIIHNKSISIIGGYDNCTKAQNNEVSNTKSVFSGNGNTSIISIDENTGITFNVQLENLEITNGGGFDGAGINVFQLVALEMTNLEIHNNSSPNDGGGLLFSHGINSVSHSLTNIDINSNSAMGLGGGLYLGSGATVIFNGSIIDNNTAKNGAGAYISGSDNILNINDSHISNNSAQQDGGGIYNAGSTASITGNSSINNNQAENGGGIFMKNGSNIISSSGDNLALNLTQLGIHHNTAVKRGAGVFLESGSDLVLTGNSLHYANITSNTATANDSEGGGIYAARDGTTITTVNANISGNSAYEGGAVFLFNKAHLEMKRSIGSCFGNQICSKISENISTIGTLSTLTCGTMDIYQTELYDNFVESFGLIRLLGNAINVCKSTFEGNIIHSNSKANLTELSSLIYITNQGELDFAFNTVTDNNVGEIFRLGSIPSNNQTLNLNSSIIWNDPASIIVEDGIGNTFSGNCLDMHDDTLPAAFGNLVLTSDPLFADAANDDYTLTNASPITDICDTTLYLPIAHDISGKLRDVGFSGAVLGDYDLGAHEYASDFPYIEEIFLNGFE